MSALARPVAIDERDPSAAQPLHCLSSVPAADPLRPPLGRIDPGDDARFLKVGPWRWNKRRVARDVWLKDGRRTTQLEPTVTVLWEPPSPPCPCGAALVRLPHGLFAVVDAQDAERVLSHKWHAYLDQGVVRHVRRFIRVREAGAVRRVCVLLHRFILGSVADGFDVIDHRDGDPLNNRRENLRPTDALGNARNVVHSRNQKVGEFKGVSERQNGRWSARIKPGPDENGLPRKALHLGRFGSAEEAARAYDAAAVKYFGEFASTNFPISSSLTIAAERANKRKRRGLK